jgi:hypothetical protein
MNKENLEAMKLEALESQFDGWAISPTPVSWGSCANAFPVTFPW